MTSNQASAAMDRQSGSILIWIFIMVALFGALSFVLTQTMRGGTAAISKDKAKLMAAEILQSAQAVSDAVKIKRIEGCTDSQISLQNSVTPFANYYINGSTTSTCKIFESTGQPMAVPIPPTGSQIKGKLTGANFMLNPQYAYTALNQFYVNDNASELVMWLFHVQPEVCDAINTLLGIGPNINTGDFDFNESQYYNGAYKQFGFFGATGSAADLNGKKMACANYTGGYSNQNGRVFYSILLNRS